MWRLLVSYAVIEVACGVLVGRTEETWAVAGGLAVWVLTALPIWCGRFRTSGLTGWLVHVVVAFPVPTVGARALACSSLLVEKLIGILIGSMVLIVIDRAHVSMIGKVGSGDPHSPTGREPEDRNDPARRG